MIILHDLNLEFSQNSKLFEVFKYQNVGRELGANTI